MFHNRLSISLTMGLIRSIIKWVLNMGFVEQWKLGILNCLICGHISTVAMNVNVIVALFPLLEA